MPAKVVTDIIESIGSKPLGEVIEGQLRFPLVVRLPEQMREGVSGIGSILIPTAAGERLPLSRLADIRMVEGPVDDHARIGASGGSPYRPTSAAATSAASSPRPSTNAESRLSTAAGALLRTNSAGNSNICSGPARGC